MPNIICAKQDLLSRLPKIENSDTIVISQEFSSEIQKKNLSKIIDNFFGEKKINNFIDFGLFREFDGSDGENLENIFKLIKNKNSVLFLSKQDFKFLFLIDLDGDLTEYNNFFKFAANKKGFNLNTKNNIYSFEDFYFSRDENILYIALDQNKIIEAKNRKKEDSLLSDDAFMKSNEEILKEHFLWIYFLKNKESSFLSLEAKEDGIFFRISQKIMKSPNMKKEEKLLKYAPKGENVFYFETDNPDFFSGSVKYFFEHFYAYSDKNKIIEKLEEMENISNDNFAVFFQIYENTPSFSFIFEAKNRQEIDAIFSNFLNIFKNSDIFKNISINKEEFLGGDFNQVSMDLNNENLPFKKIFFTFGTTDDGITIFSNHPNFIYEYGKSNFNMDWIGDIGENFFIYIDPNKSFEILEKYKNFDNMSFEETRQYFLEKNIASLVKNIRISNRKSGNKNNIIGKININKLEEIKTFSSWIKEEKEKDSDGDSISDFDERFLLGTDRTKQDTDEDGINDMDEIMENRNPLDYENQKFFIDLEKDHFAHFHIMFLKIKNIVQGFEDGKYFYPNRKATRSEVLIMAMKSFEFDTSDKFYSEHASRFDDINKDDWYAPVIGMAKINGIVQGYKEDNTFRPNSEITRAEAIAMIFESAKLKGETDKIDINEIENLPFPDVEKNIWYFKLAFFSKYNKIINGRNGNFCGNENITRGEVAVIIYNFLKFKKK